MAIATQTHAYGLVAPIMDSYNALPVWVKV